MANPSTITRPPRKSLPLPTVFLRTAGVWFLICAVAGLAVLPWETDRPLGKDEMQKLQAYYSTAYTEGESDLSSSQQEEIYLKVASQAAKNSRIKENLEEFVRTHGLEGAKALDVGAGRGYLQDIVDDYTGLDISPSASRFFHKRFVLGSATSMPFENGTFDLVWSIWVLEHVPNPEQALSEIRRTVKDGGLLYLMPAWNCGSWLAEGYAVRPYSDLTLRQKLLKAVHRPRLVLRNLGIVSATPMRWVRWKLMGAPAKLHYTKLEPNYTTYWEPDSDALNSIDRYEMLLWFLSRGDECLNCDQEGTHSLAPDGRLIIRVHKNAGERTALVRNGQLPRGGSH